MCLTCGCMEPNNDHGDPRHLLASHVAGSAALDGVSLKKAVKTIRKTMKVVKRSQPDRWGEPSHADVPPPPG